MTQQERMEMYRTYLVEEGYCPKTDTDGNVFFNYEGGSYVIQVDENDEEFFRMIYPNFWQITDEGEGLKVAQAALYATERTKVAKVFVVKDNTWASVEMLCSPPEVFKPVFQRAIMSLKAGVSNFVERMQPDFSKQIGSSGSILN